MKEGAGVAAHEGAGEGEGLVADVGQDTGGDPLGGSTGLVFVDFVGDQEFPVMGHPVLDVIGKGVPFGTLWVGGPEASAAIVALVSPAAEVFLGEGGAVAVFEVGPAIRTCWDQVGFVVVRVP